MLEVMDLYVLKCNANDVKIQKALIETRAAANFENKLHERKS